MVLLLVAGCGGSSGGGGWEVVEHAKFSSSETAYLHTTIGRPSDVQLKVDASPNVKTTTSYSVSCGVNDDYAFTKPGPAGQTPVTGSLRLPDGPAGGCFINVRATKSKPAELTVTLLTRPPTSE